MKLYKILIPLSSQYVAELYNLALKTPEIITRKQIQDAYFRHITYQSQVTEGVFHRLEEHRYPGIGYRHLIISSQTIKEAKIYPLDSWLIRKIFFEYYDKFTLEG